LPLNVSDVHLFALAVLQTLTLGDVFKMSASLPLKD